MKIALIGYGKMGKAVEEIALQRGHEIVLRITKDDLAEFTPENIRLADVCIEFSSPEAAYQNVIKCLEAKRPTVCGSTGWLEKLDEVKQRCLANKTAFLYASNFSVGVNLFFEINRRVAELMKTHPEYKLWMEEIHHTEKKDAPSGTAVTLAQELLAVVDAKKRWVNAASDQDEELGIVSKRIDPAPGTHIIHYDGEIDSITLTHTAHSRKGFAAGAVLAAEFINGKSGIFSMSDVLKS